MMMLLQRLQLLPWLLSLAWAQPPGPSASQPSSQPAPASRYKDLKSPKQQLLLELGCPQGARSLNRFCLPQPSEDQLSSQAITRVIRQARSHIKACYEHQLKRDPQLRLKPEISFEINVKGRVEALETGLEEPLHHCLKRAIQRLRFPPPKQGRLKISFP